ncbi:MAG: hypothetical protein OXC18_24175 [Desulfurellaceae bacterium]|nr:hypothetical protein [Desulfurellaceae bacterium]
MAFPVRAHAIALDHQQGRAFLGNSKENMLAITMPRNRDAFHLRTEFFKGVGRLLDAFVNIGLRGVFPAEAFLDNAET